MEVLSAAASLMALVLGALAIWLAVQYYVGTRTTERDAIRALDGIVAQTQNLEKITDRVDRLARINSGSSEEKLAMLASTMAGLPSTMFSHLQTVRRSGADPADREALVADLVNCYIELYYYTGVTNLVSQALLPEGDSFDLKKPEHRTIQALVDRSADDFIYMTNVLRQIDDRHIEKSPYAQLLDQAQDHFRLVVANSQSMFEARERKEKQAERKSQSPVKAVAAS
jgi:hypothetical protein